MTNREITVEAAMTTLNSVMFRIGGTCVTPEIEPNDYDNLPSAPEGSGRLMLRCKCGVSYSAFLPLKESKSVEAFLDMHCKDLPHTVTDDRFQPVVVTKADFSHARVEVIEKTMARAIESISGSLIDSDAQLRQLDKTFEDAVRNVDFFFRKLTDTKLVRVESVEETEAREIGYTALRHLANMHQHMTEAQSNPSNVIRSALDVMRHFASRNVDIEESEPSVPTESVSPSEPSNTEAGTSNDKRPDVAVLNLSGVDVPPTEIEALLRSLANDDSPVRIPSKYSTNLPPLGEPSDR